MSGEKRTVEGLKLERFGCSTCYSGEVNEKHEPHGRGVWIFADPETCEAGEFCNGTLHGIGTRVDKDDRGGTWFQTGEWREGVLHGWGIKMYPDGSWQIGEWRGSSPHGAGALTWPDGSRYEGTFSEVVAGAGGMKRGVLMSEGRRFKVGDGRIDEIPALDEAGSTAKDGKEAVRRSPPLGRGRRPEARPGASARISTGPGIRPTTTTRGG